MKSFFLFLVLFLSLLSCTQQQKNENTRSTGPVELTQKIKLSPSLETRREEFENYVKSARERIQKFAAKYPMDSLGDESYFDSVMVFDKKEDFDKTLLAITESDPALQLPETYCAALEKRILIVVSPEIYSHNYPEGLEEGSYEKLLTHEIAHRLHIRILNNREELMGPIWFYEGFAIYVADQFMNSTLPLSDEEMWKIVGTAERGSYVKYSYIFRHFAKSIPLNKLIQQAGHPDFESWLRAEATVNKK